MTRWIKRLLGEEPEDDVVARGLARGLRDATLDRLMAAQTLFVGAVVGHVLEGSKGDRTVDGAQARLRHALSSYVRMEVLCARPVLRAEDLPSNVKDL